VTGVSLLVLVGVIVVVVGIAAWLGTRGTSGSRESNHPSPIEPGIEASATNLIRQALLDPALLAGATPAAEAQVRLGLTKLLVDLDPDRALACFEGALAHGHRVPAAWLGKAYAQSALLPPTYEQSIDDALRQVQELTADSTLVRTHTILLYGIIASAHFRRILEMVQRNLSIRTRHRGHEFSEEHLLPGCRLQAGLAG
jgi:hypothetical protein